MKISNLAICGDHGDGKRPDRHSPGATLGLRRRSCASELEHAPCQVCAVRKRKNQSPIDLNGFVEAEAAQARLQSGRRGHSQPRTHRPNQPSGPKRLSERMPNGKTRGLVGDEKPGTHPACGSAVLEADRVRQSSRDPVDERALRPARALNSVESR